MQMYRQYLTLPPKPQTTTDTEEKKEGEDQFKFSPKEEEKLLEKYKESFVVYMRNKKAAADGDLKAKNECANSYASLLRYEWRIKKQQAQEDAVKAARVSSSSASSSDWGAVGTGSELKEKPSPPKRVSVSSSEASTSSGLTTASFPLKSRVTEAVSEISIEIIEEE